jgi:catechol 2,3-dioxygenase-like lactoylglutathione lyase family enzyme
MHKSRLAGFIIDCKTDDLDGAAAFWTRALGFKLKVHEDDPGYRNLDTGDLDLHVEVQQVDHPSRVHLDIESDDIEAEAQRLEKLGAKRIATVKRWIVMEAPSGQRFCVVRPQSREFAETANVWK